MTLNKTAQDHRLDARLEQWLEKINQLSEKLAVRGVSLTPESVRGNFAAMTSTFVTQRPSLPWVNGSGFEADGVMIPVRIYDPAPDRETPVCLYFHGGGHMAGSVDVYDPICRKIAAASGSIVVSVEYRLSPEHPYPRGLEDCISATRQVWSVLDNENRRYQRTLSIAGDSGGGAFAATISAQNQTQSQVAIDRQVLIYPGLDYTLSLPSITENGHGYLLDLERIEWYFDHYFQNSENRQSASPLYMPVTGQLPRTLVISAGFCPLRDEAFAYCNKLRAAGVDCRHQHFDSMIHAYLNLENLVPSACAETYRAIGTFLNG